MAAHDRIFERGFDGHQLRQSRMGLALTPAERLRWLEQSKDELSHWVGRARRDRRRVDAYWASHFDIDPAIWSTPGLTVTRHNREPNDRRIFVFERRGRVIVAAPESWLHRLRASTVGRDPGLLVQHATLKHLVGGDAELIGPVYHGCLLASWFRRRSDPAVRAMRSDDEPLVDALARDSGVAAWDESGLAAAIEFRHGYFEAGRLVAMAGFRRWNDQTGDPCVLCHPDHRGRGHGTAVVSAVVEKALAERKLLLFRALESNAGSVGIARRLGFERYARGMVVRLG